ncbi:MAG: Uma2 family endonuclease [Crocosphaera sp.]
MITEIKQKMSFEEYLVYDDGTDNNYELEDGDLLLMNPPTGRHALIIRFLYNLLESEIKVLNNPWLTLQNIGIRTSLKRSRIPDLAVINREQIEEKLDVSAVIESPPILVIEIVSPESIIRDYRYKRSEYSVVGIPEYWIVDPEAKRLTVLLLVEGLYEEIIYQENQKIVSNIFPALEVTVKDVLEG